MQGAVKSPRDGTVSPQPGVPGPGRPMPRRTVIEAFASFGHRNYRLWYAGQAASLVGTWMQFTTQGFLVFQLTHSPAFLGYVGFASGAPIWLFTLLGGVVSDRMPLRNLLLITQTTMMILAFILAALSIAFGGVLWLYVPQLRALE